MNKMQEKYLRRRGEILRNYRLKCKVSQKQLAKHSGMSANTISLMENGRSEYTTISLFNYMYSLKQLNNK